MAKLYVFGIGGTGARVLRSFTMMLAAGVNIGVNEVVPILIDPDVANADLTRTVTLMNLYKSIRSCLNFVPTDETQYFRTVLSDILPSYTLTIQNTNNRTFGQFIGVSSMSNSAQALMRMLFSEKNLSSSMDVGFKGNPNIGSVVLNQMVNSDAFNVFANSFADGDKIFIVSSIFGGTGASGFPLLLKTLRHGDNFPNNAIIRKAEIGAITILPYFKLQPDNNSEIDSSTFISKTKSALAYYENNICNNGDINALYFLADDVTNTYNNNEGGVTQKNDAHFIEFLAASAIVDFSKHPHENTVNKELGLKDLNVTASFNAFYEEQRQLFFEPLTEFIMLSNCFIFNKSYYTSQSFNANNDNFRYLYSSEFFLQLERFTKNYVEWLAEMKSNRRSLDLFNLSTKDKPFDVVTDCKPRSIFTFLADYDLVTDRLNSAVRACHSANTNNKFLEMFHIGLSKLIKEKFNMK